jgi:hypothetical protein
LPWINTNQYGPLGRYSTQYPIFVPNPPPTPPQGGQKFTSLVPGAQPTPASWLNGVAGNNQVFTGVTLEDTAFAPTWLQADNVIAADGTEMSISNSVTAQNPASLPVSVAVLSTAQFANSPLGDLGTASYLDFFINNSVAVSIPIICSCTTVDSQFYPPDLPSDIGGYVANPFITYLLYDFASNSTLTSTPDVMIAQPGIADSPIFKGQVPGALCNFFTPNFFWTSCTLRSNWYNKVTPGPINNPQNFVNSIVLSSLRGGLLS